MKKIITLTAALALAAPTLAVANGQDNAVLKNIEATDTTKVRVSTAAPAAGLTSGMIAGLAITVIGIAAVASGNNSATATTTP